MRDPKRIKRISDKLQKIWSEYPDLRFNQLIFSLAGPKDAYFMEDDEFELLLDKNIPRDYVRK